MKIITTLDYEHWRERIFHYALKDTKDPLETYQKFLTESEENMDPLKRVNIDTHPDRDWLRST